MSGNDEKVIKQTEAKEMAKTTFDTLSAYLQFPYGPTVFSGFRHGPSVAIQHWFLRGPDPLGWSRKWIFELSRKS